jgi:hypothetical protein
MHLTVTMASAWYLEVRHAGRLDDRIRPMP